MKNWSTRKKMLFVAATAALLYCIAVYIANITGSSIDETNTEQFYSFCKWLAGFSCAVGTVKTVTNKNNKSSDNDYVDEYEEEGEE